MTFANIQYLTTISTHESTFSSLDNVETQSKSFYDSTSQKISFNSDRKMEKVKNELNPIIIPLNQVDTAVFQDNYDFPLENEFAHLINEKISPLFCSPFTELISPHYFDNLEVETNKENLKEVPFEKIKIESNNKDTIENETIQNNKNWMLSTTFKNLINKTIPNTIEILIKTRCQKPMNFISERLYSSLKYEIIINCPFEVFKDYKFILAKIYIIESKNDEEIKIVDSLIGTTECSLILKSTTLTGNLKIQISNQLSYHHLKKENLFQIRFFDPTAPETPLLLLRSSKFKIFARKPNKSKEKEQKSKNEKEQKSKNEKEQKKKNEKELKRKNEVEEIKFSKKKKK